jgi:predicted aspartyl protease
MRAAFGLAPILLALASLAGAASSQEPPTWLRMAMAGEAVDPQALRKAASSEGEQKLVAAIELAWLHRDAEAAVALRTSADTLKSTPLRVDALNMLTAVHLRAGDYALAAAARRESRALIPPSNAIQSDLLAVAEALKAMSPMTLSGRPQGVLPLKVEKDGIPRARVAISGLDEWAVLDTGAAFSVVSQSVARQAGVRELGATARFSATGNGEANAGLGVADEVVIAEAKLRNVVVLILPDDYMDIFSGETKVGAIIGLPVFLKMGRIAMLPGKDGPEFTFGPSGGQPGKASNMRLHKLIPIVSGTLKRPEPQAVNMLLDTGASVTSFNARFAASFPELVADAPTVSNTSGVIGEASLSRQAGRLGQLRFEVGGTNFTISGAPAFEEQRPSYDGAFGQDILRMGFIADFETMTFELGPQGFPGDR